MAQKFRRCEDCPYYNFHRLDKEDPYCSVYGYDTREDTKGNQGCYRSLTRVEKDSRF